LNTAFNMGGGETIAEQILKTFALPDVVGSKTSSKKLINLLRGHVLLSTYNLPPPLPLQALQGCFPCSSKT
jgi:hypothetical protein